MSTIHDPPVELLKLRTALDAVLAYAREADQWAEQAADVNRIARPDYADLLDRLRDEIETAQNRSEMGTPATLAHLVGELLGERG